jgi:hypothetical protein
MPLYRVGYSSYEECPQAILFSHKEYTQEEFRVLVLDETVAAVKARKVRKEDEGSSYLHGFQDVYFDVAQALVAKHGFVMAEFKGEFWAFGWASMFDKSDWKDQRDDDLDAITDRLLKEGFTRDDDDYERNLRRCAEEAEAEEKKAPEA